MSRIIIDMKEYVICNFIGMTYAERN